MNYEILLKPTAQRQLKKLTPVVQKHVITFLESKVYRKALAPLAVKT